MQLLCSVIARFGLCMRAQSRSSGFWRLRCNRVGVVRVGWWHFRQLLCSVIARFWVLLRGSNMMLISCCLAEVRQHLVLGRGTAPGIAVVS